MDNQGTPKTLDEAIKFALCVGPLSDVVDRSYFQIKDFLSQRFGVAMLLADEPTAKALQILFDEIVRREN